MLDDLGERGNDLRIELGTSVRDQLGNRGLTIHRLTIRPVSGHGVVGVTREDNPRGQWDFLARKAIGITGAVPALVAGAHNLAHTPEQPANSVEHELAFDRVVLDDLELLLGQRSRLVKDVLRD